MVRARDQASNGAANAALKGMSEWCVMPFLNLGNWRALTPPRAYAASAVITRCALDASRELLDMSCAIVRAQQDIVLHAMGACLGEARDGKLAGAEKAAASLISAPVLGAVEAFARWSDAVLQADGVTSDSEIAD